MEGTINDKYDVSYCLWENLGKGNYIPRKIDGLGNLVEEMAKGNEIAEPEYTSIRDELAKEGFRFGRGDKDLHVDLTLPDTDKVVSRNHGLLKDGERALIYIDQKTNNGTAFIDYNGEHGLVQGGIEHQLFKDYDGNEAVAYLGFGKLVGPPEDVVRLKVKMADIMHWKLEIRLKKRSADPDDPKVDIDPRTLI